MIVYEEMRNEIIAKYLSGKKIKELSDEYGIPYSHVISICKNFSNNSEKYGVKMICESCGKEFIGKKTSKYCSKECSIVIRKIKCALCGNEFVAKSKKAMYCSRKCANKSIKREYKKPKPQKQVKPKLKEFHGDHIAYINALARAEGLTYGQYVAKHHNQ